VTELRELPGVGPYTAGAVASIAFGEPAPVVDGNVKRVLSRLLGLTLTDDRCWQAAGELLDQRRPGDFNQALMELGAMICLPGKPVCEKCPVAPLCTSRGGQRKRKQSPRRKAVLNYVLARKNGCVLLRQRESSATLMPGMWELPPLEAAGAIGNEPLFTLRHSITTTDYAVRVFAGDCRRQSRDRWIRLSSAERLPLTGLARKILRRLAAE